MVDRKADENAAYHALSASDWSRTSTARGRGCAAADTVTSRPATTSVTNRDRRARRALLRRRQTLPAEALPCAAGQTTRRPIPTFLMMGVHPSSSKPGPIWSYGGPQTLSGFHLKSGAAFP